MIDRPSKTPGHPAYGGDGAPETRAADTPSRWPEWVAAILEHPRRVVRLVYGSVPGKRHVFKALRRVWRPPEHVYRHLHFKGVVEIPVRHSSFRVRHHGFMPENMIFWGGIEDGYEARTLRVWLDLVKRSEFIVDVGANTGIFALAAQATNPCARVVAVEPAPAIAAKLRDNVSLNAFPITCLERAISDEDGEADLYGTHADHALALSLSLEHLRALDFAPGTQFRRMRVRCSRLDTIAAECGLTRFDLLKIDVESYEPQVVASLGEHLATDRPTMIVEVIDATAGSRLEEMLRPHGYRFYYIDERAGPMAAQSLSVRKDRNYLAIARGQTPHDSFVV